MKIIVKKEKKSDIPAKEKSKFRRQFFMIVRRILKHN